MALATDLPAWLTEREKQRQGQAHTEGAKRTTMQTAIDAVIGQSAQGVMRTAMTLLHQSSTSSLAGRTDDEATVQGIIRARAVNAGEKSPG